MPRQLTTASRWAAVATWLLAAALLERTLHAGSAGAVVLQVVVLVAATLGAAKMWVHNCFEAQLVVLTVVVATVVGTLLSLTLGMPGGPVAQPAAIHVVVLTLSGAIVTLLVVDARTRRGQG